MPNIESTCGVAGLPKIAITGFRDANIIESLKEMGYDASDSNDVVKDTVALIALDPNANSSKIQKARRYGIPIISLADYYKGVLKAPQGS